MEIWEKKIEQKKKKTKEGERTKSRRQRRGDGVRENDFDVIFVETWRRGEGRRDETRRDERREEEEGEKRRKRYSEGGKKEETTRRTKKKVRRRANHNYRRPSSQADTSSESLCSVATTPTETAQTALTRSSSLAVSEPHSQTRLWSCVVLVRSGARGES
jgi:hypothetical protein